MTKRKTHEEFVKEVYDLVGDEYEVIGEYTLGKNKVLLKHKLCNNLWDVKANNFLNGNRCKHCREKNKIKKLDDYKNDINIKYKGNIEVLTSYKNCDTKVKHRCKIHGNTFMSTPTNALRNNKKYLCPKCSLESTKIAQRKDINVLKGQLKEKHSDRIILVGEYVNTHTKTSFKCSKCNHTFETTPASILKLSGCPKCKSSKGELLISDLLTKNNINFYTQHRFDDCRHKRTLPFDFYIPVINTLIEYDGMQHFKPIDFFGGEEHFNLRSSIDDIKNKYAKDKGIKLIRIPYYYTEQQIVTIINKIVEEVTQRITT